MRVASFLRSQSMNKYKSMLENLGLLQNSKAKINQLSINAIRSFIYDRIIKSPYTESQKNLQNLNVGTASENMKKCLLECINAFRSSQIKYNPNQVLKMTHFLHIYYQQLTDFINAKESKINFQKSTLSNNQNNQYIQEQQQTQWNILKKQICQVLIKQLNWVLGQTKEVGTKQRQKKEIQRRKSIGRKNEEQNSENKQRSFSMQNTFGWLKRKFSLSKDKIEDSSLINHDKNRFPLKKQQETPSTAKTPPIQATPEVFLTDPNNQDQILSAKRKKSQHGRSASVSITKIHVQKKQPQTALVKKSQKISSKQQLFCSSIIQPYITYILKLITSYWPSYLKFKNLQVKHFQNMALNTPQLYNEFSLCTWKLINAFKSVLSVTEKFSYFFRYYLEHYKYTIVFIIKVIHVQIKNIYQCITLHTKWRQKQINEIFMTLQEQKLQCNIFLNDKSIKQQIKIQLLERIKEIQDQQSKVIKQLNLQDYKSLIQEIGEINEGLTLLYLNKYIYAELFALGIKAPPFIKTSGDEFDFLFKIIKEHIDKEEEMKKMQSEQDNQSDNGQQQNSSYMEEQRSARFLDTSQIVSSNSPMRKHKTEKLKALLLKNKIANDPNIDHNPRKTKHEAVSKKQAINPAAKQRNKLKLTLQNSNATQIAQSINSTENNVLFTFRKPDQV